MINLLNLNNVNISKMPVSCFSSLKLQSNSLKPLSKDTVSFSANKTKTYELEREIGSFRFFQEFPIDKDNSYKVIYYTDITKEAKEKGIAPFPPSHIEFKKPIDMQTGLEICKQHLLGYNDWSLYDGNQIDVLKNFLLNCKELKDEKMVSSLDMIHNTIVLELEDNRVLKMVKYNPFPEGRKFEPSFDLPVLSDVYNCGDYYVFVQEKADTDDVDMDALESVMNRIVDAGYELYDIEGNETQVGWSEIMQDYMLLDTECAVKK